MADLLNNITLNRYNISNFIKFTNESNFKDFDFYHNKDLFRSIDEVPAEGILDIIEGSEVRLDKISNQLYGTTALWWWLALYNHIPNIFCSEVTQIKYPSLAAIEAWYFTNRETLVQTKDSE